MNPSQMTTTSPTEITLHLSLDEVNLLLEAVGALPFARVFNLVSRIQSQAAEQIQAAAAQGKAG